MRIGIDVGGTNLKAGLVDEEGKILTVCRAPVGQFTDGRDFARILAELALKAAAQGGVRPGKITGVGIGIPGAVREGQVLYTCNLPLRDVPLADWFREMCIRDRYETILDVQVPILTVPVRPGRALASIVEVAAMNNRYRYYGHNAAAELASRVDAVAEGKQLDFGQDYPVEPKRDSK